MVNIFLEQLMICRILCIKLVSRGSALYMNPRGELRGGPEEMFRFCPDSGETAGKIQQVRLMSDRGCAVSWREVRPIPDDGDFFENVWRQYRENKNIF